MLYVVNVNQLVLRLREPEGGAAAAQSKNGRGSDKKGSRAFGGRRPCWLQGVEGGGAGAPGGGSRLNQGGERMFGGEPSSFF